VICAIAPAAESRRAALHKICKEIRKSSTGQTNRLPRGAAWFGHDKNHTRFIRSASAAEEPAPRWLVAGITAHRRRVVRETTAGAERQAPIKTQA
jgi:hypothetical protein